MFDIGGWEFFLILLLALLVIGPKDLPLAIRTVTQWIRRARMLAREFQSGLDDIASEAELEKVKADLTADTGVDDIRNEIHGVVKGHIDPDGEIEEAVNRIDDPLGIDNGEDDEQFLFEPFEDEDEFNRKILEEEEREKARAEAETAKNGETGEEAVRKDGGLA